MLYWADKAIGLQVNFRYFNRVFRDNDKNNEYVYDRLLMRSMRERVLPFYNIFCTCFKV